MPAKPTNKTASSTYYDTLRIDSGAALPADSTQAQAACFLSNRLKWVEF